MQTAVLNPHDVPELRCTLLTWYAAERRDLPWRHTSDPYAIWVSEIMLQQTRVAAVVNRFQEFLARFPNVTSLASAEEQDVLALWSGLGYYRRARMMHSAAKLVAAGKHGLPASSAELRALPGIGAYTAAAIASIAYGERVPVVDGNVERVLCRLMGWSADTSASLKRKVQHLAVQLVDPQQPGDFNQALMELGATVCLPRSPRCSACPLHSQCLTRGEHKTRPRAPMQHREVAHALAVRSRSRDQSMEVFLEQRPASESVMPGLWQLPALHGEASPHCNLHMTVRHSIMQVNYSVRICRLSPLEAKGMTELAGKRRWVPLQKAAQLPLTGLTRKVLMRAHLMPGASRA